MWLLLSVSNTIMNMGLSSYLSFRLQKMSSASESDASTTAKVKSKPKTVAESKGTPRRSGAKDTKTKGKNRNITEKSEVTDKAMGNTILKYFSPAPKKATGKLEEFSDTSDSESLGRQYQEKQGQNNSDRTVDHTERQIEGRKEDEQSCLKKAENEQTAELVSPGPGHADEKNSTSTEEVERKEETKEATNSATNVASAGESESKDVTKVAPNSEEPMSCEETSLPTSPNLAKVISLLEKYIVLVVVCVLR